MRLKLLSFAGFRVGACQFLLAICSALLNTAAFGENGMGCDGLAHYPEDEIPMPIWIVAANGRSFEFTIEFEPIALPTENINRKRTSATIKKPVDEFIEAASQEELEKIDGDAFSDYYRFLPPSVALSEFAIDAEGEDRFFSDSFGPILRGFTDGPPLTRKEAFPPRELLNFIFSRPVVSPLLVETAVVAVHPARKVRIKSVFNRPIFTDKTALPDLLRIARRIKSEARLRVLQYTLSVSGNHAGRQKSFAWGNVFAEKEKGPVLAALFARAAVLEKDSVRRHFYLGTAACHRKDWDEAWRQFQQVYKNAESDAEMAREIVKTYRDTGSRNLELCIWLTRYLKVAKDWDSFELAYEERERIEYESYVLYLASEPGSNFAWPIERLPLKVFFGFEEGDHLKVKKIVEDSLGDWTRSTGGKIDFVETSDQKKADLVCKWEDDPPRYSQYDSSTKAPMGQIRPRPLADTDVEMGKEVRKATIRFRGDGCGHHYASEDQLKLVCLHETGHALGIFLHLKDSNAIMNAFAKESRTDPELTKIDKETICHLYKNHPVNQSAVMKFIGQVAVCQKLSENRVAIKEDDQLSSAPSRSVSEGRP